MAKVGPIIVWMKGGFIGLLFLLKYSLTDPLFAG